MSTQDPDGDYYPRIERIEDQFGNLFEYRAGMDLNAIQFVKTAIRLRVGEELTFRAKGHDSAGRNL